MRVIREEWLIKRGDFALSEDWKSIHETIITGIQRIDWPPGSGKFTIYPVKQGNGVKPIKNELMRELVSNGWQTEGSFGEAEVVEETLLDDSIAPKKKKKKSRAKRSADERPPGDLDAVVRTNFGPFVLEWETGNISSSHRAINKMALGMVQGKLIGGILIVPTRKTYKFLTDRIGNIDELLPYLELWKALNISDGVLGLIAVEHDAEDMSVKPIPKGTDGRALR